MPNDRLAKLFDLKVLIGTTETTDDSLLLLLMTRATARAEVAAGRPLARRDAIVEYPYATPEEQRFLRLRRYPIESITSIIQRYDRGTAAEFAATAALTEYTQWRTVSPEVADVHNRGVVERVDGVWYLRPGWLQVVYAGGYVDPARVELSFSTATWTASTKTLTVTNGFSSYTYAAGDVIVITGGTGATTGAYVIASKVDASNITLNESLSAVNLTTGDIAAGYASMILPPMDLQQGVVLETQRAYRHAKRGGDAGVDLGGGGRVDAMNWDVHPALMEAVDRLMTWAL